MVAGLLSIVWSVWLQRKALQRRTVFEESG